ncbi:MAG: hypothetical protein ACTSQ7_00575 [Alphaproteobacteria bacterium]
MTGRSRNPPQTSEAGQAARAKREARLAEALRDNLRKRKAQVRDRARDRAAADPGTQEDVKAGGEVGGGEA